MKNTDCPISRMTALLLAIGMSFGLTGCSKAGETDIDISRYVTESSSSANEDDVSDVIEETSENKAETEAEQETAEETGLRNPLTGELGFSESAVGNRPVTIMINNIGAALPQRGIAAADMIFEMVVEGGITRMMGVYADVDSIPYVGPVRSARHYYVELSEGLNALFVHFGGSPTAYNYISQYGVDDVDGKYCTSAFYQDTWRAETYGREHSFFIDGATIREQAEANGESLEGEYESLFDFSYDETVIPETGTASDVYVPFSGSYNAEFIYDAQTGLYSKKRNGEDHVDADSGETIQFSNVLILYTTVSALGDGSDRRNLDLSSGSGWYITAGSREEINWSKGAVENTLEITDSSGEKLEANVGKTYICITDKGYSNSVSFD